MALDTVSGTSTIGLNEKSKQYLVYETCGLLAISASLLICYGCFFAENSGDSSFCAGENTGCRAYLLTRCCFTIFTFCIGGQVIAFIETANENELRLDSYQTVADCMDSYTIFDSESFRDEISAVKGRLSIILIFWCLIWCQCTCEICLQIGFCLHQAGLRCQMCSFSIPDSV